MSPGAGRARLLIAAVVGLAAVPASAEQFEYLRMVQSSSLDQGDFTSAYSLEVSRGLVTVVKGTGGGGTGGGGGLGGQSDYQGVMHRLFAYYAPLRWLSFGVEQSIKQPDANTLQYNILYPEARVRLPWLRNVGLETSAFAGSRVRINARRASTWVTGVGVERRSGRYSLLADVAFETSLATDNRENGLRYEAGASVWLVGPLSAAFEFWGTAVWQDTAPFQHSQHGGPTLRIRLKQFWIGSNVGFGVKDRPNKTFYDYTVTAQVGLAL